MKIHQTLHGYSEGHILLASSISTLTQRDRKKMAVLSDWDEYARKEDDSSYITAYPLPDSPYYVIAKTWYANEMERPGCVWTHSLLLDISEGSDFFDYRALFFAFVRPQRDKYTYYNKPLDIKGEIEKKTLMPSPFKMPSLAHWLHILLKKDEPLVFVVDQPTSYYQLFLLSLMNHLPIGILSKMSMCSGTGRIRKYENKLFDLQFIVNNRNNLPKINSQIADVEEGIDWCQYVAQSIQEEKLNVPMLLHRFASDIGGRMDAYAAVVMVYMILDRLRDPGEDNIIKFRLTLRILAEAFASKVEGANFKSAMLDPTITKYYFDERSFIYEMAITKYWEAFDYEKLDFAVRAKVYFKSQPVNEMASLLEGLLECKENNPYKQTVLDNVDIEYNQLQVESLIEEHWKLFCYLAQKNDKALNNDFWLNTGKEKFTELVGFFFKKVPEEYLYWRPLLEKMLEYNYAADTLQIETLSSHVLDMSAEILFELNEGHYLNSEWVGFCKRNPQAIISWLGEQGSVSKQIVSLVLESIDPESEMVKRSENTKWRVLQSAPVELGAKLEYAVFLFLLSYNLEKDELAFSLYRRAFQTIYEATEKSQIGYYWRRISVYCPRPFLGLEWDKCELLRKGFANRVYDEGRNIGTARNFTTEKRINKKLLKATVRKFEAEG